MRILAFLIVIISYVSTAYAQGLSETNKENIRFFIDCIKKQQKEKLADKVIYPLNRDYPLLPIRNKSEFIKRYHEVFDAALAQMISKSSLSKDWATVGWRGIMFSNGKLWLDEDGSLRTVNYASRIEESKRRARIEEIRTTLHSSLKEFSQPILVFKTSKFLIRVDEMKDNTYRYASWTLPNKMSSKPDIVISKGEFLVEGTAQEPNYRFKNKEFTYECSFNSMSEELPRYYVRVFKEKKEIIFQKANLLY
ncbi:hypothetical protein [Runella sp. SP2]|uniref:hypothetical protein n=1 Tax=Runella sp. SP2 TaxID=2268026 RepID=UPI000F092F20|nr:hypothetical protein [Runella sp. SP2]AYQ31003.1 hypothetical protein DTQ70_01895 [Runella sp. SP2]